MSNEKLFKQTIELLDNIIKLLETHKKYMDNVTERYIERLKNIRERLVIDEWEKK